MIDALIKELLSKAKLQAWELMANVVNAFGNIRLISFAIHFL